MAVDKDWLKRPYNSDGITDVYEKSYLDSGKYYNPVGGTYKGANYSPSDGNGNRGGLDRLFDLLQVGQYTIQGGIAGAIDPNDDLSVGQGMWNGLKAGNPFGQGNKSGEYYFSDNLGKMGWNPTSKVGKAGKWIAGFAGDVLLDPMTYINPLSIGGNAIIKGTGTKVGKEVIEKFTPDMAEAILKKTGTKGVAPTEEAIVELVRRTNKARGIVEEGTGKGFGLYGDNIPFAKQLGLAGKKIEFVSEAKLRAFGDSTFAPFMNKVGDNILHSKVGSAFSTKAGLLDMARKDPEGLAMMFSFAKKAGESNYTFKEAMENLTDKFKEFSSLDKTVQVQITDMLENKKLWEGITTYKPLTSMKAGADLYAVIDKYVKDFGMDDAKLKKIMDEITPKFVVNEKVTMRLKGIPDEEAVIEKAFTDTYGKRFYKIRGFDNMVPESAFVEKSVLESEARTAYRKAQTDSILKQKASMDAGDSGRINLSDDNIGVGINGKPLTSELDKVIERGEIPIIHEKIEGSFKNIQMQKPIEEMSLSDARVAKKHLEKRLVDATNARNNAQVPESVDAIIKSIEEDIKFADKILESRSVKSKVSDEVAITKEIDPSISDYERALEESKTAKSRLDKANADLKEASKKPYKDSGKGKNIVKGNSAEIDRLNMLIKEERKLSYISGQKLEQASSKLPKDYTSKGVKGVDEKFTDEMTITKDMNDGTSEYLVNIKGEKSKLVNQYDAKTSKPYGDKTFLSENFAINSEGKIINPNTGETVGSAISGRQVLNNDKPLSQITNIKSLHKNSWNARKKMGDEEIRVYFNNLLEKDPVVKDMFSSFKETGAILENIPMYQMKRFIDDYYTKPASKLVDGLHHFAKNHNDILPILAREFGDYKVLQQRAKIKWADYIEKAGIKGEHKATAGLAPLENGYMAKRMKRMYELLNNPKQLEAEKAITRKVNGQMADDITDMGTSFNKANADMSKAGSDRHAKQQKEAGTHGYVNADEVAVDKSVEGLNYIMKDDAGKFVQKTQATRWTTDGTPTHVMYNYKGKNVEIDVRQLEQKGFELKEAKEVTKITGEASVKKITEESYAKLIPNAKLKIVDIKVQIKELPENAPKYVREGLERKQIRAEQDLDNLIKNQANNIGKAKETTKNMMNSGEEFVQKGTVKTGESVDSMVTMDELTYGVDIESLTSDVSAKVGNRVANGVDDDIAKLYKEQAELALEAKRQTIKQAELDRRIASIFEDDTPLVKPKTQQELNDDIINSIGKEDAISKADDVINERVIDETITEMEESLPKSKTKRNPKVVTVEDALNKLPKQVGDMLDIGAKTNEIRIVLNNLERYRKALTSEADFETYAKQIWSDTKFSKLKEKRAVTTFGVDKPDLYDKDIVDIAKGIRKEFKSVADMETAIGKLDSRIFEGYVTHVINPSYVSPLAKLTPEELDDMGIKIPKNAFNKSRKYKIGDVMPSGHILKEGTIKEINEAHMDFAIQLNKQLTANGRNPVEVQKLFVDEISDIYVTRMQSHYKLMYDDAVFGDITKKFGTQYGGKGGTTQYADGIDAFIRGDATEMSKILDDITGGVDAETLGKGSAKPIINSTVVKENHSLVVSNAELKKQLKKMTPEERIQRMESYGLTEQDLDKLGNSFIRIKSEVADKMNVDGIASVHQIPNIVLDKAESLAHVQMAKDTHGLLGAYDKFLRTYKLAVTAYRPAFHLNNLKGNTFNNYLDVGSKALSPRLWKSAFEILKKGEGEILLGGKMYQYKDILREMTIQGKIGSGFFGKDVKAVVEKQLLDAKNGSSLKSTFQLPQRLGSNIEDHGKLINFMANLDLGRSFQEAGEHVDKFLFDYGDLTKFEHEVMQRIIPFYTWMRKNTPLQLEQMLTNPKRYAPIAKAIGETERLTDENDRIDKSKVPAFARDWVQLPFNITNEAGNQEALMWSNGMPYLDINKIPDIFNIKDSMTNLFESTSPAIRMPIELGTNNNYFFGSKIDNGKKVTDPSGQFEISPQLNYVLSQIPQVSEPGGFVRKKGIDKLIHLMDKGFGSGVKSYDTANDMSMMNQAIQSSNQYNSQPHGDATGMKIEPGKFRVESPKGIFDLDSVLKSEPTMEERVKKRNASLIQ